MRSVVFLLFLLSALAWGDDLRGSKDPTAPAGWLRYSLGASPELSIVLPARPVVRELPKQPPIKSLKLYSAQGRGAVGVVEVSELSVASERESSRKVFFDASFREFKSSFEKGSNVKLIASGRKPASIGNFSGFEENYEAPALSGRLRVVLRGYRSYYVGAFVVKGEHKTLDQFMKSARLK